jgi:hypothetical protein
VVECECDFISCENLPKPEEVLWIWCSMLGAENWATKRKTVKYVFQDLKLT